MFLQCGLQSLDLTRPLVMGVLNVTPDSFSDGGRYAGKAQALSHALRMVEEGAGIIDIGGESTRPGSQPVETGEEVRRVVPVVEALASRIPVPISVDTSKPEVMRAAVAAGAVLINDIRALREPGALQAAADGGVAICLMHMQGEPRTMQAQPGYKDVVSEVRSFLDERVTACRQAGIDRNRILLDPGIGFGKRLEHNLALMARLGELASLELPLLIGVSRKSVIGTILNRPVDQRLYGGLAFAVAAVLAGAKIVRAHDVAATVDAVRVAAELRVHGYTTEHLLES